MDIQALLIKQAKLFPEKPAVIFEGQSANFPRLKENSFKLANYLLNLGIKKGDKVAVFMPNLPETVISFLGVFSAGAGLIPLDFMSAQEEVVNFINHSQAKVLITLPKKEVDLEEVKIRCVSLKEIIVCGEKAEGAITFAGILAEGLSAAPPADIDEDSLSSIFYTSGSTGQPKGVMLTYRHFNSPVQCITHYLPLSCEDRILCGGIPFSHLGGLDYILLMLYFGQTLVLMPRFHPWEFLKNIGRYKISLFWTVPAMYVAMMSLKAYDKFDLSSLKYAVVFGAPSSPALLEKFREICPGAHLINGWGMTETSAPNCFLPPGIDKIESIGKFPPGMEAKVVDERGSAQAAGQTGELWVRGAGVMAGYYQAPDLTREVLTADGWLKTGDIAKFDEDGLFYIAGRKKDMIKVAGEIVFSAEVEEKIQRHPKVKEAAVIGVFDKLRGEVPKAYVVFQEEESLEEPELKDFLKAHLAHFKIPHYFEFIDALPKNRTGKVDKPALQKRS